MSKNRFILVFGVLGWGISCGLLFAWWMSSLRDTNFWGWTLALPLWCAGGVVFGNTMWRQMHKAQPPGASPSRFLGGQVIATLGSAQGEASMGTAADLQKATGEIRVHRVRTREGSAIVTIEFAQAVTPGDGAELTCVRLPNAEASRLARMLRSAAEDEVQRGDGTDPL